MSQETKVQISRQDFTRKVSEGWKREELAEHYGIKPAHVTRILKDLGIKLRKFHSVPYQLVDDEPNSFAQVQAETINHTVSETDVANNPSTDLVAREQVTITETVQEGTELPAKEETPVVEKATRKPRKTKAEKEAEIYAAQAADQKKALEGTVVQDPQIGEAKIVEETTTTETAQAPDTTNQPDVAKVTENVETNFNIPTGASNPFANNVGSEDAFNQQPTETPIQSNENPFTKAWGQQ